MLLLSVVGNKRATAAADGQSSGQGHSMATHNSTQSSNRDTGQGTKQQQKLNRAGRASKANWSSAKSGAGGGIQRIAAAISWAARKDAAKTIIWQIIICATCITLNPVHKKTTPLYILLYLSLLNFFIKLQGKDSAKSLITYVQPAAFFISSAASP